MDPGLKIAGVTRRWESKFFALKQFRPLVEPFRGDKQGVIEAFRESTPSVIPEIFYRESTFLLFPLVFGTVGASPPII